MVGKWYCLNKKTSNKMITKLILQNRPWMSYLRIQLFIACRMKCRMKEVCRFFKDIIYLFCKYMYSRLQQSKIKFTKSKHIFSEMLFNLFNSHSYFKIRCICRVIIRICIYKTVSVELSVEPLKMMANKICINVDTIETLGIC